STTPKPATSYRRKKAKKEDTPEDIELYRDPTTTLYYISLLYDAVTILLVDGYNVCGYWAKLKKHFLNGRLDMVIVFDAVTLSLSLSHMPLLWK
ncbi:LOW QUALITY PROTEIN: hypothetical protein CFOL_v3_23909, partial [Cephalotus follicularis]